MMQVLHRECSRPSIQIYISNIWGCYLWALQHILCPFFLRELCKLELIKYGIESMYGAVIALAIPTVLVHSIINKKAWGSPQTEHASVTAVLQEPLGLGAQRYLRKAARPSMGTSRA